MYLFKNTMSYLMTFPISLGRIIFICSVIGVSLSISACASLPEMHEINSDLSMPDNPAITNAHGTLSTKNSRSLLDSTLHTRWKNSHADLVMMAAMEEAATGKPLIAGNKVTLLYDGPQTMAAMMEAINSAQDHINLETYIFDQDEIGIRFSELLIARQLAGVQVNIIYDSVGTIGTPQHFFDKMRDAGIRLLAFNPINPLRLTGPWEPNNRDHRKILVVDGRIAFTGGVNISSTYANSSLFRSKSRTKKQSNSKIGWRDTHIKIEGPAVAALQWLFLDTWMREKSPDLSDSNFFPPLKNVGDKLLRVLASEPDGDNDIYKAYVLAIREAKKTIHITCAYFVPDTLILEALSDAVGRGVEVAIILPGVSDNSLVFHATQSFYTEMLQKGIKVYQLQIAVLHAKTAVIDQIWATVGSTNIDRRSFLHNNEINVVVFGSEFGLAMENTFTEDLRFSVEMTTTQWVQRPLQNKLREWFARRLEYWL
jgi:cardiolipin synthase